MCLLTPDLLQTTGPAWGLSGPFQGRGTSYFSFMSISAKIVVPTVFFRELKELVNAVEKSKKLVAVI
jgi:hypothetical protein